jgi:hypothetical protein
MPGGVDGFELAEKLRQKIIKVKIIFTSWLFWRISPHASKAFI